MSQAGWISVEAIPEIPTLFIENVGFAIPIANTLEVLGSGAITTTGAGNVITISAAGIAETLTGNTGGAVSPDGSNNINILGDVTDVTVTGNPGTNTLTISLTGAVGKTITGDVGGALSPTAGNWNILSAVVAAGSVPIQTSGAASTLTIDIQKSQAIAGTDATKIGLAAFNSAQFTVDANGFVSSSGTGVLSTLTGNSGGAISPTAGNINTVGTGSITIVGSGSTLTTQLTGLTVHNVLLGEGTATIGLVAPSATSGVPLISQGVAADPIFGTAVVAGGGTGAVSFTAYAPVCGGTTTTNPLQSASTGLATAGFVLTSNGNASLPSFQAVSASGAISSITGNTGGAEVPSGGNFNVLGTGSITVAGTANTETVQLTGLTNHNVLIGAGTATITNLAPSATSGVPLISQGAGSDPAFGTAVVAGGGTGAVTLTGVLTGNGTSAVTANTITQHGVLIGGATNAVSSLGVATTGTVLAGNTGADPSFQTIATLGGITTITGNSGGAESPLAGNFNILGTGSITVAGSANTETVQLTGLTNHSLLVGAATATITNLGVATNGQLPIGSAGADPVLATLSAGSGIAIANGTGTITISATGAGFAWSDQSGAFAAVKENGYFITAISTATLPASPAEGDTIAFVVDTTQVLTIQANTGQLIRVGSTISAAAGTATSNARGDSIELVYRATGTTWFSLGAPEGTWTVT